MLIETEYWFNYEANEEGVGLRRRRGVTAWSPRNGAFLHEPESLAVKLFTNICLLGSQSESQKKSLNKDAVVSLV